MLLAVLLSAVIAVQVQVWREVFREKRNRKLSVFQTLMCGPKSDLGALRRAAD